MRRPVCLRARITALLLTFALALAGWAHRPMVRAELLALAGPDGTLPFLCIADGGEQPGSAAEKPCPACTLVSSALPGGPAGLPARSDQAAAVVWPLTAGLSGPSRAPFAPPARGPPHFLSV